MRTLLIASLFLLLTAPALAQTNPCTATKPAVTLVTTTSQATVTMADYNATFGGQPVITDLDIAIFNSGADPNTATPVSTQNVLKASWTLVTGTTDCYQTPAPFLAKGTPNTVYDMWVRSNGPGGKGAWTGGSGAVPFGLMGPPAARTGVRITP